MKRGWGRLALLGPGAPTPAGPLDELVAAARAEGALTIIALPRDWAGYGAIIDNFKAKYGLVVNELAPKASSAMEIEAIRRTQGPQSPDVIDVGFAFGPSAKAEALLQPYKVSTWDTIPERQKDPEGHWYGDYYGVVAFEINSDIVRNPPQDWGDLMSPEYRNAVALAGDPRASSQAIHSICAAGLAATSGDVDRGTEAGLAFFARLAKVGNFVPVVANAATLARGETPIVIRWDYLAHGDRDTRKGRPAIDVVVPKTTVAGVYVQAISARAPHPNAAKLWMEHLYSDASQLTWLKGHCHPIRLRDLVNNRKVPVGLLETLPPIDEEEGVVFPTIEQQRKAREIITNGWDDAVGVRVLCECDPVLAY